MAHAKNQWVYMADRRTGLPEAVEREEVVRGEPSKDGEKRRVDAKLLVIEKRGRGEYEACAALPVSPF